MTPSKTDAKVQSSVGASGAAQRLSKDGQIRRRTAMKLQVISWNMQGEGATTGYSAYPFMFSKVLPPWSR